jgi:hypothetical protein
MYARIRAEARRQRHKLLERISSSIELEEPVDLNDLHQKLDSIAKIEALRSPSERALHSLLPLLIAVLVLLPFWMIHQSDPNIELSARVSRVVIFQDTLDKLDLGSLGQVHLLRVEGLDELDSDLRKIDFADAAGNGSVYLDGSSYVTDIELVPLKVFEPDSNNEPVHVRRLAISKHSQLGELDVENFKVHISANFDKSVQVVTSVPGQTRQATPADGILNLNSPATIPTRVRLFFGLGEHPIGFPVMYPRDLLLRETAFDTRGEREGFSSIEHGTLTIIDTGQKYELLRSTTLSLGELDGALRITLVPDGIDVAFHGIAGVIGLGGDSEKTIRDLRPSLAEWISSDRYVALVWSSLVFVVGLVLTVRRSVFH